MKKIKRILFNILVFIFTINLLTTGLSAESNNDIAHSWYCIRTKDHSRPPLPSEFSNIESYDAYYLGKNSEEKTVYLTFDAGYENGNIQKTLDILKANNVKGAFFILKNLIKTSPDLLQRMSQEGHTVCNHTASHKDMSKIKDIESFSAELDELERLYKEETGMELANFFRPPEGRFSVKTLCFAQKLGYKTIFWSFAYEDWDNNKQMSEDKAKKKILDNIHNGAVILLHPTSDTNAKILDDVIKELKDLGYRFGTLDELTSNA